MISNKVLNRQTIVSLLTIFLGLGVCESYAGDDKIKYDLPKEIRSLKESDRTDPPQTFIDFDSTLSAIADSTHAVVWFKFKADKRGGMENIKVVFSSHSNLGLEKRAIEAVEVGGFALPELSRHEKYKWLYHEVIFDRELFRMLMDSLKKPSNTIESSVYSESGDSIAADEASENFPNSDEFVPLSTLPEMILAGTPEFPREAKNVISSATIWVKVLIDSTGHVLKSTLGKSCGYALLDSAAVKSGWKSRFKPGRNEEGAAVSCWASYKVEYKVEK